MNQHQARGANIAKFESGDPGHASVGNDTFAELIDDLRADINGLKQALGEPATSSQSNSANLTTSIEGVHLRERLGTGIEITHLANSRNAARNSISALFSNFSFFRHSEDLSSDPIERLFQIAIAQRLFESRVGDNYDSKATLDLLA